jgi:hypothetical protein
MGRRQEESKTILVSDSKKMPAARMGMYQSYTRLNWRACSAPPNPTPPHPPKAKELEQDNIYDLIVSVSHDIKHTVLNTLIPHINTYLGQNLPTSQSWKFKIRDNEILKDKIQKPQFSTKRAIGKGWKHPFGWEISILCIVAVQMPPNQPTSQPENSTKLSDLLGSRLSGVSGHTKQWASLG